MHTPTTLGTSPASPIKVCLHVTSAAALAAILEQGLLPQLGPLSQQVETREAIFMFPSWHDLQDANWLFDEAWPYESEPALLCVDVSGLDLDLEAGFEAVALSPIEPGRITVLAPDESNWDAAEKRFIAMGGRRESLSSKEVADWLQRADPSF